MKCVDTCLIVDLLRGSAEARRKAEALDQEGGACTTSVSAFELWLGIEVLGQTIRAPRTKQLRMILDRLDVLELDRESAEKAATIFTKAQRRGKTIQQNDALIAAICIARGCQALVTRNVRHFEDIPGLSLDAY